MRLIDADELEAMVKRLIELMPTVDPVKHGRWMGTVCSACGESFSEYYDCNYCPNCGAKMDEEE